MTARLLLLLPPSEAKAPGGGRASSHDSFGSVLDEPRREVADALLRALNSAPEKLATLLKARGELLEHARRVNAATLMGSGPWLPAWRRYTGVVWRHLDLATLGATQRRRVLVPSALLGLHSAVDDIADYRLAMSASLPPLGPLSSFWRRSTAPALREFSPRSTIVNLLPREHAAAIDLRLLRSRLIPVRFVSHDGQHAIGHDAKAAKGALARMILCDGLPAVNHFEWLGWRAEFNDDIIVRAPEFRVAPRKLQPPQ